MKNITKAFVLLLVISIVFVTYKSFYLEGFEQVPGCGDGDTGAPACYATVRNDYNGFADIDKNDYILKTQIVTPVCPNSPYTEWDDEEFSTDKDDNHEEIKQKRANSNFFPFGHFGRDISYNTAPEPDSKPSTQAEYKESLPLLNNQPIPDYNLSIPKVNVPAEPASSNDKKSQPSNVENSNSDSCPPCPACKRCPEPVVECKKVVNYKRAGIDNLPVPMISDFSKF